MSSAEVEPAAPRARAAFPAAGWQTRDTTALALCAGVFVLALGVRAWTNTWLTDFWGDSYHHWLITRLTLQNGVYSDFKGLEVVWPPLYHYVSMLPLIVSGRTDILPLHWMNTFFGALTCALVCWLAWRLFRHPLAAFTGGAVLALMTWHIAFSGMNVTEVFAGLLILGVTLTVLCPREDTQAARVTESRPRPFGRYALLFLFALAMPLTRTDLCVYLGIIGLWLLIQRRYAETLILTMGAALALGAWSAWSWSRTGNPLYWYQQYATNNLHDWLTLNGAQTAWSDFAAYLSRLSPFVLPALTAGVLGIVTLRGAARRNLWLVTALLAGHSLFLIVGYGRGLVPLLTERYLAMDLPLTAALMGAWVWLFAKWGADNPHWDEPMQTRAGWLAAGALILLTALRFQNDIPELQIRRWGIDPEWQVGNFLMAKVQPGDVVLTDAPVAIYRSGKPLDQFISSVELARAGQGREALARRGVRWVVVQNASYDAAEKWLPTSLLTAQESGTVDGVTYELAWRYDPQKKDIQPEVWHVIGRDRQ